jgi:hypothetical protein
MASSRCLEKVQISKATLIDPSEEETDDEEIDVTDPARGSVAKRVGGTAVSGKRLEVVIPKKLEKGIMFARFVKCMGAAKGNLNQAYVMAKNHYQDSPQLINVLKAQTEYGDIRHQKGCAS